MDGDDNRESSLGVETVVGHLDVRQVAATVDQSKDTAAINNVDHDVNDICISVLHSLLRQIEWKHAESERLRLEKERLDMESLRKMQSVRVVLRPVDNDWVMGEDWLVDFPLMSTMSDLLDYIEAERNICRYRIQLRLKGNVLVPNRESWTFRRFGIYEGYVIQVEPTLRGGWLWNPISYYHEKLLQEVGRIVRASPTGRVLYDELMQQVVVPPCIQTSLKVFLRKYPDRIYIHTDITEGHWWVHMTTKPFQLPTFGHMNIEIGRIKHFQPAQLFDWSAHRDVDDMYQLASFEAAAEEEDPLQSAEGSMEVSSGSEQRQLDALDELIVAQSGDRAEEVPVEAAVSAEQLAEERRLQDLLQEAEELDAALGEDSDYDSSVMLSGA